MRIIGNNHDYYDVGLAHGRDDAVVFVRGGDRRMSDREMSALLGLPEAVCAASLVAPGAEGKPPRRPATRMQLGGVEIGKVRTTVEHATAIIAGTLHRGILLKTFEPYGIRREIDERWAWSGEAVRAYCAEHGIAIAEGRAGSSTVSTYDARRTRQVEALSLDDWFKPVALAGDARAALVDARITVAFEGAELYPPTNDMREGLVWRIDQAGLSEIGFAKALDPYTCFQEIAMWKGGVLPSDGPAMVEITDNAVKIAKAGFHHPTSFRRAKADAR